jgi:Family of unknown function (DUF6932)
MIPSFDDNGNLPPGVYPATIEEIAERFGKETEIRRAQMQSLRWLCEIARRAGVTKIAVNGSFISEMAEPNDVDCALLLGADYPKDEASAQELTEGLPFVQMYLEGEKGYNYFVEKFFATDREDVPKGMVEVTL